MKFRTPYTASESAVRLTPAKPVVMLGSCFADNIAGRMRECLWRAENPLGVLYNPVSIASALELMLADLGLEERCGATVFQSYGLHHSWMFDSSVSAPERSQTLSDLKAMSARLHWLLERAGALFVTFGTATVWYLAENPGFAVGNCHKQPASCFTSRRLDADEIAEVWKALLTRLREDYPDLPVIFTISPVRYLKEGFAGNSLSKAVLRLAVDKICSSEPYCHYFPAYEIYMDDLRDYRFYGPDLVHPSAEGVDYVWELFKQTYLGEEGMAVLKAGKEIRQRYRHRPNIKIRTPQQEENLKKWREDTLELWYSPFHEQYPDTLAIDEI